MKRRAFVRNSLSIAGALAGSQIIPTMNNNVDIEILNPRNRVPVSFVIDDSTALVNLAYYGIPQFKEVFPENYKQNWRKLPREIPDSFVREFLSWCDDHGVKGKYSMVPYPACTGWLNRFIPGWTKQELEDSISLVRESAQPNWDIHPEMISHTRVINIKTGMPYPDATPEFMENWKWSQERSADELGEYIAYALRILQETGLYCEGVTTPGGFATRNIPNLAQGTRDAVHEIYGADVAHYFRNIITESGQSVVPQVSHPRNLNGANPQCAVHIIGCTGDWFGGWDGLTPGDPDKFITADLKKGRMVDVIEAEEPAVMVCHWPGIYYNGDKLGFNIFKTVVNRLHEKYDHLHWMKLSDIARYWAAKEYTEVTQSENGVKFYAPFASREFTIKWPNRFNHPVLHRKGKKIPMSRIDSRKDLTNNTWYSDGQHSWLCFDLPKGKSQLSTG